MDTDEEYDENESDDYDGNSDLLEISIILTNDEYHQTDTVDDDPNVVF